MHRYERFAQEVLGRAPARDMTPLLESLSDQDLVAVLAGLAGRSHEERYRRNVIATELSNRLHANGRLVREAAAEPGGVDFHEFTRAVATALGMPIACLDEVDGREFVLHGKHNVPPATAHVKRCAQPEMALCHEVLETGRTFVVGDLSASDRWKGSAAVQELGLHAYAGAPGRDAQGRIACVVWVGSYVPRELNDEELLLLRRVAERMAREFTQGAHPHPWKDQPERLPLTWEELPFEAGDAPPATVPSEGTNAA